MTEGPRFFEVELVRDLLHGGGAHPKPATPTGLGENIAH